MKKAYKDYDEDAEEGTRAAMGDDALGACVRVSVCECVCMCMRVGASASMCAVLSLSVPV
jgi:hypothetical protein